MVNTGVPSFMDGYRCEFVIIQSGPPYLFIVQRKTEWFDQMKSYAGIRAQANNIPGVGGNLWLIKDDVEHNTQPDGLDDRM